MEHNKKTTNFIIIKQVLDVTWERSGQDKERYENIINSS